MSTISLMFLAALPLAADLGVKPTDGKLFLSAATPAVHRQRTIEVGGTLEVIVTNTSDQSVRVWRDWCSWGYYNVSLEFRDGDGKTWVCEKKPRGWTKNYPDAAELAAGESMVFKQELGEEIWENLPKVAAGQERTLEMRVRYAIEPDDDTKQQVVWTGKLATKWQSYRVVKK